MATALIQDVIPSTWRKSVYAVYAVAGVVIGATQVGYAAAEIEQPTWLIVTLAVYAFVGGAVGLTATSHTPQAKHVDRTTNKPPTYVPPRSMGPEHLEAENNLENSGRHAAD